MLIFPPHLYHFPPFQLPLDLPNLQARVHRRRHLLAPPRGLRRRPPPPQVTTRGDGLDRPVGSGAVISVDDGLVGVGDGAAGDRAGAVDAAAAVLVGGPPAAAASAVGDV